MRLSLAETVESSNPGLGGAQYFDGISNNNSGGVSKISYDIII